MKTQHVQKCCITRALLKKKQLKKNKKKIQLEGLYTFMFSISQAQRMTEMSNRAIQI